MRGKQLEKAPVPATASPTSGKNVQQRGGGGDIFQLDLDGGGIFLFFIGKGNQSIIVQLSGCSISAGVSDPSSLEISSALTQKRSAKTLVRLTGHSLKNNLSLADIPFSLQGNGSR